MMMNLMIQIPVMRMIKMAKKKILDADTRNWSKDDVKKIENHLRKYKYQIDFIQADGRKRFAYSNDEPKLIELYMKSIGAKILKVSEID